MQTDSRAISSYRLGEQCLISRPLALGGVAPTAAYRRIRGKYPMPFCLESSAAEASRSRYTVIGCAPDRLWRVKDGIAAQACLPALENFTADDLPPLVSLRSAVAAASFPLPIDAPDVASGLFGYIGYDMVRFIETLPQINAGAEPDLPDAMLMRPRLTAVFDMANDTATAFCIVVPREGVTAEQALAQARARLEQFTADLCTALPDEDQWQQLCHEAIHSEYTDGLAKNNSQQASPPRPTDDYGGGIAYGASSNMPAAAYMDMVDRAKEYIRAGDAFQIVLAQRFSLPFTSDPFAFFCVLREVNPSPYLLFFDFHDFAIAGSSPEILVRLRNGLMTVRPLAGTRARGNNEAEDKALETDLLADEKELAEHMMLIDLGRNDVGRVSVAGAVNMTQQFVVERYSAVMHIVSEVVGRLHPKHDAVDALCAGFPAGTLSGAPKIRAMEIIEELEPTRRGIYGGAVGYISASGNMDTCIAIRTAVIAEQQMIIGAGAGIVADSVSASENEECYNKARALLRSAARTQRAWQQSEP